MNSTIEEVTDETPEFPCLRGDKDGMIVLFTEDEHGTVVHLGNDKCHSLGHFCEGWCMELFKPTDKIVNLFN